MDLPLPPARGAMLKPQILPAMQRWLTDAENTYVERVDNLEQIEAGDILLFDAGMGHLAVSMGGKNVIHAWHREGVHYTVIGGSAYEKRLLAAWRPVNPN